MAAPPLQSTTRWGAGRLNWGECGGWVHGARRSLHCSLPTQSTPDNRTVYVTDDTNNAMFLKFVADTAGDLSAGSLYASQVAQTSTANGGTWNMSWVLLGSGARAGGLRFSGKGLGPAPPTHPCAPPQRIQPSTPRAPSLLAGNQDELRTLGETLTFSDIFAAGKRGWGVAAQVVCGGPREGAAAADTSAPCVAPQPRRSPPPLARARLATSESTLALGLSA